MATANVIPCAIKDCRGRNRHLSYLCDTHHKLHSADQKEIQRLNDKWEAPTMIEKLRKANELIAEHKADEKKHNHLKALAQKRFSNHVKPELKVCFLKLLWLLWFYCLFGFLLFVYLTFLTFPQNLKSVKAQRLTPDNLCQVSSLDFDDFIQGHDNYIAEQKQRRKNERQVLTRTKKEKKKTVRSAQQSVPKKIADRKYLLDKHIHSLVEQFLVNEKANIDVGVYRLQCQREYIARKACKVGEKTPLQLRIEKHENKTQNEVKGKLLCGSLR